MEFLCELKGYPLLNQSLKFYGVGIKSWWIFVKTEAFCIPLLFPCYKICYYIEKKRAN